MKTIEVAQTCFAALSSPYTLMDQYYRTLSVDTITIVSNECPNIVEQVVIMFLT